MLKSMTGFGQVEASSNLHKIRIEIRSVNHRYLEISAKLPGILKSFERKAFEELKKNFSRGKFELFLNLDSNTSQPIKEIELDLRLAENYIKVLKELKDIYSLSGEITVSDVAKLRDIFILKESQDDESCIDRLFESALSQAISAIRESRISEGIIIEKDMRKRVLDILKSVQQIDEKKESFLLAYKDKLQERIKKISSGIEIDPAKIEEQIVLFAEKSDITEEVLRAKTHLENFLKLFKECEPVGRKMDFYIQEINREINTMSSKSSSVIVSETAVIVKAELEKIREQVQNVE